MEDNALGLVRILTLLSGFHLQLNSWLHLAGLCGHVYLGTLVRRWVGETACHCRTSPPLCAQPQEGISQSSPGESHHLPLVV